MSVKITSTTNSPVQMFRKNLSTKIVTVQSKLKIAKNSNRDSTSNRRAAPNARMKNLLVWSKSKISIQFEDQLCSCTPRHLIIVEDTCALLHENQSIA